MEIMRNRLSIPIRMALARLSVGLLAGLVVGCATTSADPVTWIVPPADSRVWIDVDIRYPNARVVRTRHFEIFTTISDREFLLQLGQTMESALHVYQRIAPTARVDSAGPMQCFVFADRRQWAQFTAETAGEDAKVYLSINRGGYTLGNRFVAYYLGHAGTMSIASHEGWHLFVSRSFRTRPPPFLEEGIATLFEYVEWHRGGARFNLGRSNSRSEQLARALERNELLTLDQMFAMHAGDLVTEGFESVETFYAQNWAFARYLLEGDGGRHRAAFDRFIADCVAGTVWYPDGYTPPPTGWSPAVVAPMLEHYFRIPISELERGYRAYVRTIAKR
jgi:hypothetical protein